MYMIWMIYIMMKYIKNNDMCNKKLYICLKNI